MQTEGSAESKRIPIIKNEVFERLWVEKKPFLGAQHAMRDYVERTPLEQPRFDAGLRSMLVTPLLWKGEVEGVLTFRSTKSDAFGEHEVDLALQISQQIAGHIATADQYAVVERESKERQKLAEEQSRIADIGRIVSSTLDVQEVLEAFVEQARELVPLDRIIITSVNDESTMWVNVLGDGIGIDTESIGIARPIDSNTFQKKVISEQWQFSANGEEYSEYAKSIPAELKLYNAGLRSILLIPLIWQGRCFGSMNLRSVDPEAYGEHEIELSEQIGAQIAGAISTSNQYRLLEAAATAAQSQIAALEAAGDAIVIRGLDKSIEYVNKAFETQTGYTLEEVAGPDLQYRARLSLESDAEDRMWEQVLTGQSAQSTFIGTHRDGTEREFDTTLSPIFDDDGKIIKFVGIRRDVTERVRAEDDIRTQAAALNAAGDSVIILKPDSAIEWVNEEFVRSSGYSKEEAIGQQAPFMRSDNDPPELFDGLWEQVLGGESWSARMWTSPKTEADFPIDASLTPVFDDAGNIIHIVGTWRDITDVVQAEKDRESTRDLDAQNQQLLQLNEQREEFFSTVSHELRTPLTSVMAFTDILSRNRDGALSNLQLEHLDVIKRNSKNLNALIEDMLDFSQLSTDRLKLHKSEFEIHLLLEAVVESLGPTASQRDQSLTIKPSSTPIWITADFGRINQVVSNLITNSCKYSPESTQITVLVEIQNQRLLVSVTDQRFGIPEDDLEQIFSPFFRTNQTVIRNEIGTGLGLAISKTLIELHDGTIEAFSELGEGTKVTLMLPGASSAPTPATES